MNGGLPIIGQTRTWKTLRFIAQPVGKPPAIVHPEAQMEVTGWMVGFEGLRSDDVPVRAAQVVPLTVFTNVQETLKIIGGSLQLFESYRTCACLPNAPCPQHTQTSQRPS